MGPPIKAAGSNGIARKWLKEAEKKWEAHEQKQKESGVDTSAKDEAVAGGLALANVAQPE